MVPSRVLPHLIFGGELAMPVCLHKEVVVLFGGHSACCYTSRPQTPSGGVGSTWNGARWTWLAGVFWRGGAQGQAVCVWVCLSVCGNSRPFLRFAAVWGVSPAVSAVVV